MRHGASLIASIEGVSKPAFFIARELAQNSRSGLTLRFLSKKLELPEEEVEYLVDVNHGFLFTDLTKIKIVPEGHSAVKRIVQGLENRGDIPNMYQLVKSMPPHDFRRLEEQLGIDAPGAKKATVDCLVETWYKHPENILEYVGTRGFSETAQELFDILWQAQDGIMSISKLRAAHGGSDYDIEQGLWELFRSLAAFEMFRFDAEDRLVRFAGLLSEIRQWKEETSRQNGKIIKLQPVEDIPNFIQTRGLDFSDQLCQVIAAVAARPLRLRSDGELFREDRRRLEDIISEEAEPSLGTCLWVAQGAGWLTRVDNALVAGEFEALIELDRLERHKQLYEWFSTQGNEALIRRILYDFCDDLKPDTWYKALHFTRHALRQAADDVPPLLRQEGGVFHYLNPATTAGTEKALIRALEENLFWLGIVDRAEEDGDSVFRLTEIGRAFLTKETIPVALKNAYPPRSGEIVVQPNFDIVVPIQDMDPLLTVPLDQFAERVSTGQATVYRVTKDSFTNALQEGYDGDAFVQFLLTHNREKDLPKNVMMTLEDWRGGIKRVRLRTIHVIESDDPLVMADLLHRRKFRKILHPADATRTAIYSKIAKEELQKELEKDGIIVD